MANFVFHFKGGGGYALNDPVSSNELNLTGQDLVKAANFTDGSSHAPAANIILTGPYGILADTLTMSPGNRLQYSSRTVVRRQPLNAIYESGEWQSFPDQPLVQQITPGGAAEWLLCHLPYLPDGNVLDSVTVSWDGASGHPNDPLGSGAGITMPELEVLKLSETGGVTTLGTQTDTQTDRTLYQASHPITVSGIVETIDLATYVYYIRFRGEFGAEEVPLGTLEALKTSCTVTEQPES